MIAILMLFNILAWPASYDSMASVHEFHLSKCDIDYSVEDGSLQVSLSLFIDDLELALAADGYEYLKICSKDESPEAEAIILHYIQSHLHVTVDDIETELTWIGKEISEDLGAVWTYLEIKNVSPTQSIKIENDILMDTFNDQQNVVKLVMSKAKKSFFLFNKKNYSGTLKI